VEESKDRSTANNKRLILLAVSNRGTLIIAAALFDPIHVNYEKERRQHTSLSEINAHMECMRCQMGQEIITCFRGKSSY